MRSIKWVFFGYLLLCLLLAVGIAVSFVVTRARNPTSAYGTFGGGVKSLDPAEIGDANANDIAGQVYECLYNYAYGEDKYRLVPQLASGQPEMADGGKTLIIHIKPGVHFYDPTGQVFPDHVGPEVTADVFIYSWKRVCNFHLGLTGNYAQVFQGRVAGIDDWFNYTHSCPTPDSVDWNRPIEGLTALDKYTLRIRLVDPFPQLQFNLAMIPTGAVCREAVDHWGDDFKNHPVGTGAYVMETYLPDQQIIYTANPIYRGGPDVMPGTPLSEADRLPHTKRVQLDDFDESLPPWYLFLQGKLDASGIPKDTFAQAISAKSGSLTPEMEADGIKLVTFPEPEMAYVAFNMQDPVVGKNKALRQAMSLAFDRQRYIHLYLNDRGIPANGPIPPGFPTYEANRADAYSHFDLAAAKAKMIEAINADGGQPIPPLHVVYGDTDTATAQEADFFATCMQQIGLTILSDFKPYGQFLEALDRKQAQIFTLGWVADYPDEQDFWQLYYSKNAGLGGLNGTSYSNPEFDTLYEQSAAMPDSPERTKIYLKLQGMVLDDCPMIFTVYPISYELYHGWLKKPWVANYGYGFRQFSQIDFGARTRWINKH